MPILFQTTVIAQTHSFSDRIKFLEGLVLQKISQPSTGIALFIGPRNRITYRQRIDRFQFGNDLGRRRKRNSHLLGKIGERFHKFENTALTRLQLAQRFVIHKKVHHLLGLGNRIDPTHILIGGKGVFAPFVIGKTESYVIAHFIIFEQQFQFRYGGGTIEIIGTFPTENMLGSFGNTAFKAHIGNHAGNLVGINQLGIPENLRPLSE